MLTFLLVGSESFTLCWCLSPKLALGEKLHWLCSGRQHECKQAPLRGDLLLSFPVTSPGSLACCVPKSLDPSFCWQWWDWAGSRRALHELTNMRQKKIARNWKKILYFQQQRNRVGKILKRVHCAWSIYRKAPLKSLNSSDLSVLPRISRQELPPHAPQGRNQLLIKSENVTEMW